jgi:excisionase family DNA binding protein
MKQTKVFPGQSLNPKQFSVLVSLCAAACQDALRSADSHRRPTGEPEPKLLLTVEEAAQQLSIGRPKMYQLVMRGDVVSVKIGASRRVPATALVEFVERLSTGATGSTEAAMVAERSEPDGK